MKKTIIAAILAIATLSASAQTLTSYSDVFPATESRLNSLSSNRKVEDTAASSVNSVSFASKLEFPEGTTSVNFTSVTFTIEKRINGVNSTALSNISNGLSKFNDETSGNGNPNILGYSPAGVLVAPTTLNLVGNSVGIDIFLITDHVIQLGGSSPFPKLVIVGDYYHLSRVLSGNYVVNGVNTPFNNLTTHASVTVVDETDFPVIGVADYPTDPQITSSGVMDGSYVITATGLTVDSYQKTWWVETSTDLVNWTPANNGTVAPGVTITFAIIPSEPTRFWRIRWLTGEEVVIPAT